MGWTASRFSLSLGEENFTWTSPPGEGKSLYWEGPAGKKTTTKKNIRMLSVSERVTLSKALAIPMYWT